MLNQVNLIGRLTKDPEIRSMQNGKDVASFTLATSEKWKDANGERKEKSEFHRVTVFQEGLVGVVKNYTHKGSLLMLTGKLQTRKWTDNAGVEKYTTEVVLQGFDSKLILLDTKRDNAPAAQEVSEYAAPVDDIDDEIPFG